MSRAPRRLAPGVYAITDCERLPFAETLRRTESILAAGVAALQYRDKTPDAGTKLDRARQLVALCRRYHTPMIVNDDPDLALAAGADGVHVGEEDAPCRAARERLGPDAIIGVSCYDSLDAALAAREAGADYVAFGAFFPTSTKQPRARATPALLRAAAARLDVPIAAIGGITAENAGPLVAAGASLLAVVSALYGSDDPGRAVGEFAPLFASSGDTHG